MKFLLDLEDWKLVANSLGSILIIIGAAFSLPLVSAYLFGELEYFIAFLVMMMVAVNSGIALRLFESRRRFGFLHALIVSTGIWLLVPLVSVIPFEVSGMGFLDAYFESMSGWTTTGFTIIRDVEALPNSVLFFRSFTHWLGGVGIILLALTILRLPKLGHKLYAAETRSENIKLNVFDTANLIYGTYIGLTIAGIALLALAGMPLFDSVNHAMSAISTGGFSVKNSSLDYYASDLINMVTIVLMLVGGTNIVVLYYFLRGRLSFIKNAETVASLMLVAAATALMLFALKESPLKILFMAASTLTSTGFTVADVSAWNDVAVFILIILMYIGASSGSTTGAIKIWRFIIIAKDVYRETIRYIKTEHAFLPIRFNGNIVEDDNVRKVKTFVLIYIILTIISSLVFMYIGFSFRESIFTAASAQGNIGMSIISGDGWFGMADVAKIVIILNMLLGRLEILPALVLARSLLPAGK